MRRFLQTFFLAVNPSTPLKTLPILDIGPVNPLHSLALVEAEAARNEET